MAEKRERRALGPKGTNLNALAKHRPQLRKFRPESNGGGAGNFGKGPVFFFCFPFEGLPHNSILYEQAALAEPDRPEGFRPGLQQGCNRGSWSSEA